MASDRTRPNIEGAWRSLAREPVAGFWTTRSFFFNADRWSLIFKGFSDKALSRGLFTLHVSGIYLLGGAAENVAGAFNGIFPASRRAITVDSEDGVVLFAQMGEQVKRFEHLDLVDKGLGFLPPLMSAMGEYDLVAVIDERLFFGDRSGDLTKTRPTKLTAYPLVRPA